MGLDMMIYAERQLYWDDEDKAKGELVAKLFPELGDKRADSVRVEAMYWRKANAIHKWFVDHVQDGEDDCGTYDVTRDHIQGLRSLCAMILADTALAPLMLPPQNGFFFGSTDIDEWYWRDVEGTKAWCDKVLGDSRWDKWTFTYHASW